MSNSNPTVENFLARLDHLTPGEARENLRLEMRTYGWSTETIRAISDGISRHYARKSREAL